MTTFLSIWRGTVPAPKPKVAEVITEVAQRHGLTLADLVGPDRSHAVSRIRAEALYEARAITGASYPLIGRIARRDHTTVLHHCDAHARRIGAA